MTRRQQRMTRGATCAAVSALATACAHAVGGGAFPSPMLLALALVVSAAFCAAVGGARVSTPRLVVAVSATQGLLHLVFTGAEAGALPAPRAGALEHAAHAAHAVPLHVAHEHTAVMPLAHVVAGLVTIVALRAGAGALRHVARVLALRLLPVLRLLGALPVVVAPATVPVGLAPRPLVSLVLAAARALRGPPASRLAAA